MSPDLQLAESTKYSSAHKVWLTEPRPGLYALWDYNAKLLILTEDWNEILPAFHSRPAYTPVVRTRSVASSRPSASKAANTAKILAALIGGK